MAEYTRLTYNERCRIRQYLKEGLSQGKIARRLRRSKSTISTEIRRKNMSMKTYHPVHAQSDANFKRRLIQHNRKIKGPLEASIQVLMLEQHWSPEQISYALKRRYPSMTELHVSPEAIYKYIYRSPNREIFTQALRRKRKYRRRRRSGGIRRGGIRNRVSIKERDPAVETREEPGHWEGDLIIGKGGQSAIGTAVERTSRFVRLAQVSTKKSETVVDAFLARFRDLPRWIKKSFTYDQGTEMAEHERFASESGMQVYFANPGSPWQRGSNENTNGLLREFFPKGTDLSLVPDSELRRVEALLNARPRKVLGYATPQEEMAALETRQAGDSTASGVGASSENALLSSFKRGFAFVVAWVRRSISRLPMSSSPHPVSEPGGS